MDQLTEAQLKTEVERLRAKNAQLRGKLRAIEQSYIREVTEKGGDPEWRIVRPDATCDYGPSEHWARETFHLMIQGRYLKPYNDQHLKFF